MVLEIPKNKLLLSFAERFPVYKIDILLKGVDTIQEWRYVPRIDEWTTLFEAYPLIWKGVLQCTDAYEELQRRELLPRCETDFCFCERTLHGNHFKTVSHRHNHTSNIQLQKMAYIEALDAINDIGLPRPYILQPREMTDHQS